MGRELTGREPPALRTCDSRLLCPIETQSTAQTQPSSTALAHQGVPCYAARSLSGASSPGAVVLICITCLRPCHTISKKPPVPPGWSSAAGLAAPAEEGGELSQGFRLQRDGNQGTCMKLMEAESLPWLELHRCNQYVPAAGAPGGPQQDPIPQSAERAPASPRAVAEPSPTGCQGGKPACSEGQLREQPGIHSLPLCRSLEYCLDIVQKGEPPSFKIKVRYPRENFFFWLLELPLFPHLDNHKHIFVNVR